MTRLLLLPILLLAATISAQAQYTTIYEAGGGTNNDFDVDFQTFLMFQGNNNGAGPVNHLPFDNGVSFNMGYNAYGPQVSSFIVCASRSIPELTMFADFTFNVNLTEHYSDAGDLHFTLRTLPSQSCSSVPHDQITDGTLICSGVLDSSTTVQFNNTTGDEFLMVQIYYEDFDSVSFTLDYLNISVNRGAILNVADENIPEVKIGSADGTININLLDASSMNSLYHVEVMNLLGQSIASKQASGSTSIPVPTTGVYLVNVMIGEERITRRVFVP